MSIATNFSAIRDRISAAAHRAGRNPADIALMAVCKTFPAAAIVEAYATGQRFFGENRVQEFADKFPQLAELKDAEFHMIGHLQSNKAAKAAEIFHAVDSIDSAKARAATERRRAKARQDARRPRRNQRRRRTRRRAGLAPDSPEIDAILGQRARVDEPSHSRTDDRSALSPTIPKARGHTFASCVNCATASLPATCRP